MQGTCVICNELKCGCRYVQGKLICPSCFRHKYKQNERSEEQIEVKEIPKFEKKRPDRIIMLNQKFPDEFNDSQWLKVYLSIFLSKSIPESRIKETGKEMSLIVNNSQSVFTEDRSSYLGCLNSYLGVNEVSCENPPDTLISFKSKEYQSRYEFSKNRDQWHIYVYPVKEGSDEPDLYSLERLSYDLFILAFCSRIIEEKYNLEIQVRNGSCNPEMINKIPYLIHFKELLVFQYKVADRYNYQSKNPGLDKFVLGGNIQTFHELINEIMENEPKSEWTKLVKTII